MTFVVTPPQVPDLLGTAPADLIDRYVQAPVATRDVAVRRAERIRAGVVVYAAMRQDIADAYAQRDWLALDYSSWHEYLTGEFGEELRGLARDDRREAVADMRERGMTTRAIGAALGVAEGTVRNDLGQLRNSAQLKEPERVTGLDGKSRPARPSTQAGQDFSPQPTSVPAGVEERPKPPAWDPEERRAHEEEVLRLQDIRMAEQQAKTLVTDVRALIFTVLQGCRQGAKILVTRDMIVDIRRAVDLLEGEIDDEE